jgi:hypothetical protein
MDDLLGSFSGIISQFVSLGGFLLLIVVFIGIIYFANKKGLLVKRPYKCEILRECADKNYWEHATGRRVKNGFEIYFSASEKYTIADIPENAITKDKRVYFISQARGIFIPCDTFKIDDCNIISEPANNPASNIVMFHQLEEGVRRTMQPNAFDKFIIPISVIVAVIIISIAIYTQGSMYAGEMKHSVEVQEKTNQVMLTLLQDAKIVITKEEPEQTEEPATNFPWNPLAPAG